LQIFFDGEIVQVNEKYISRLLEIEREAESIQEAAQREAEKIPIQAEDDAEELIEKSRAEAEEEAHQLVANAGSSDEGIHIMADTEDNIQRLRTLSMSHFNRAVNYVLDRVAGRE
jgi:vacuolar-type H+-ATPase subunit H